MKKLMSLLALATALVGFTGCLTASRTDTMTNNVAIKSFVGNNVGGVK